LLGARATAGTRHDGVDQELILGDAIHVCEESALNEEAKLCLLCTATLEARSLAGRAHVLQLLALVEHPDALPRDAALRLASDILALTRADRSERRCDPVDPPGRATVEEAR
jgi:hypothetical protein